MKPFFVSYSSRCGDEMLRVAIGTKRRLRHGSMAFFSSWGIVNGTLDVQSCF